MHRALVLVAALAACAESPRARSSPIAPTSRAEGAPPHSVAAEPAPVTVTALTALGCPVVPRPTGDDALDRAIRTQAEALLSCCGRQGVAPAPVTWTLAVSAGQVRVEAPPAAAEVHDGKLLACVRGKLGRWTLPDVADGTYRVTLDPT